MTNQLADQMLKNAFNTVFIIIFLYFCSALFNYVIIWQINITFLVSEC